MEWYKFFFHEKDLEDGYQQGYMKKFKKKFLKKENICQILPTPIWYRSKIDDDIFYLKCVGWEI